jgi:hypothetical protein
MQTFWDYLLNEGKTAGKVGLYPLGYQGVGQYPPEYMLPGSADAILYISADERLQHCWEQEPFKIDHLKPHPLWKKTQGKKNFVYVTAKMPPGDVVTPKSLKDTPDMKRYKINKTNKCFVSEPKCLPSHMVGRDAELFGNPCNDKVFKMPD